MTQDKQVCPYCGSKDTLEIVYGLPGPGAENEPRDYILGGCVILKDSPTHHCRACGKGFIIASEEPAQLFKKGLLRHLFNSR